MLASYPLIPSPNAFAAAAVGNIEEHFPPSVGPVRKGSGGMETPPQEPGQPDPNPQPPQPEDPPANG